MTVNQQVLLLLAVLWVVGLVFCLEYLPLVAWMIAFALGLTGLWLFNMLLGS